MGIATTDFDRYERNFYETFANPPEGDIRFRNLRSNLTDEYHTKSATLEDIENFEDIFRYDKNKVPALETMRLQSGLATPKKATGKKNTTQKDWEAVQLVRKNRPNEKNGDDVRVSFLPSLGCVCVT